MNSNNFIVYHNLFPTHCLNCKTEIEFFIYSGTQSEKVFKCKNLHCLHKTYGKISDAEPLSTVYSASSMFLNQTSPIVLLTFYCLEKKCIFQMFQTEVVLMIGDFFIPAYDKVNRLQMTMPATFQEIYDVAEKHLQSIVFM